MITYKLKTPMTIGDLKNQIVVDELVIVSCSMTFRREEPVISMVFLHPQSGWTHNVCYAHWNNGGAGGKATVNVDEQKKLADAGDKLWSHEADLKKILDELVQLMVVNGDLPALEQGA